MFDIPPDLSRVALYARYSSHLQNPKSIQDQLAECHRHIQNLGGTVIAEFEDPALSGSTASSRPGLQALLQDCRNERFTAVCTEALDRISRDVGDTAIIRKKLAFNRIALITISEGVVGPIVAAFKGTMNEMFLHDLAKKTRRGQIGLIRQGRQIGPPAYGYRLANRIDGSKVIRGLREIDPETSPIVRRIYRMYLEGRSARAIARTLNEDGIPPPRTAKAWNHSALTGAHSFFGILTNPIYKGNVHYGVIETAIDPATAKRVYRTQPKHTWEVTHVPHLQIIDEKTWDAVQERIHSRSLPRRHLTGAPALARGAMPLTPLLRCAKCHGPVRTIARNRWACQASRSNSACSCNARTFVLRDVDLRCARQLLSWIRRGKQWDHIVQEAQNRIVETRAHLEAEITDRTLRQSRLITAVETGADVPEMHKRIVELSQEIANLKAELARNADHSPLQANSRDIRPILVDRARRIQSDIETGAPEIRIPATIELAGFLEHVDMSPGPGPGKARLRIRPNVISLIRAATSAPAEA